MAEHAPEWSISATRRGWARCRRRARSDGRTHQRRGGLPRRRLNRPADVAGEPRQALCRPPGGRRRWPGDQQSRRGGSGRSLTGSGGCCPTAGSRATSRPTPGPVVRSTISWVRTCRIGGSAVLAVGGIHEFYPGTSAREDSDMGLRMTRAGWHVVFAPDAAVDHVSGEYAKGRRFDRRYQFYTQRNHVVLLSRVFGLAEPLPPPLSRDGAPGRCGRAARQCRWLPGRRPPDALPARAEPGRRCHARGCRPRRAHCRLCSGGSVAGSTGQGPEPRCGQRSRVRRNFAALAKWRGDEVRPHCSSSRICCGLRLRKPSASDLRHSSDAIRKKRSRYSANEAETSASPRCTAACSFNMRKVARLPCAASAADMLASWRR